MLLTDYEWSGNPRGMHVMGTFQEFTTDLDMYRRTNMGWIKIVASEVEYMRRLEEIFEANITPIVRLYMPRAGNRPMRTTEQRYYIEYAAAGVKWFEFYNEPNLDIEWPFGTTNVDWRNAPMIAGLCDNWLDWAEFIISLGGYPGFIPLAESTVVEVAAVRWMDAMLNYMANTHYVRFLNVLRGGAYCATHPYILNHFYQERPGGGPASARAPGELRATEGGWHFEYPYDPLQQADDPGRTVYGGTPRTPHGDPVGLIAMGRMFNERCAQLFGTQAVPVVGTEGGIWDFPAPGEGFFQQDTRYPPYDNAAQAEATAAMFNWISTNAPPWFFGVTLWKEDIYREKGQDALGRLASIPQIPKEVPPLSVMADGSGPPAAQPDVPEETLRGPGPILGQADFHMLIIDNQLGTEWFFRTAVNYWDMFRPIVTNQIDFLELLPYEKSLAVTLLVTDDRKAVAEALIRDNYPNTYLDTITVADEDSIERVAQVFAVRVQRGLRFG
jgi:hypothetical protein